MKETDVRLGSIKCAVARMPTEFHTKDVSEDAEVVEAHGRFVRDTDFHARIGKALSDARGQLHLSEVAKNQRGRGSLWRKRDVIEPAP
jgi:hypothetical protein